MPAKREEGLSSHESFLFYTIFSWQVSSSSLNKRQEWPPPHTHTLPPHPGWLLLDGCVWTSNNHTCESGCGRSLHTHPFGLQTRRDALGEMDFGWCKQSRGGSQQVSHSHNAPNGARSLTAEPGFIWCFSSLSPLCVRSRWKIYSKNKVQMLCMFSFFCVCMCWGGRGDDNSEPVYRVCMFRYAPPWESN